MKFLDGNESFFVSMSMKHIPALLVLPLLLFALVSCDGHSPTDPFGGRGATLSGVVSDPYGSVWGGVSVALVDPQEGLVASALTDHQGRYSISRVDPGPYRVRLQLGRTGPGYFVGDVVLHEGRNTFDVVSR
jgi:hypothetical protein